MSRNKKSDRNQSRKASAGPRLAFGGIEGSGLLLTPTIDHLFDRGFIFFENNGELLISPVTHENAMKKMGIITDRVLPPFFVRNQIRGWTAFDRPGVRNKINGCEAV